MEQLIKEKRYSEVNNVKKRILTLYEEISQK